MSDMPPNSSGIALLLIVVILVLASKRDRLKICTRCGLKFPSANEKCTHCGDLDDLGLSVLKSDYDRQKRTYRQLIFVFSVLFIAFAYFVLANVL